MPIMILYPETHLSVYTTDRRVNLIEDGIDVALRVGTIAHENMVARRLLTYRHIVVASPALLQKFGKPAIPEDLHRFPCAVWGHGVSTQTAWRLGGETFTPDAMLSINDYLHLRRRALADEVVTELPPFLATQALREGVLEKVLPAYPLPEQQINLLYSSHHYPSSIIRAYLDFYQEHISYVTDQTG